MGHDGFKSIKGANGQREINFVKRLEEKLGPDHFGRLLDSCLISFNWLELCYSDVDLDNMTKLGKRVPLAHESSEEVVNQVDPSLTYTMMAGTSARNRLYIVRDVDGSEKILKVAARPEIIEGARREHGLINILNQRKVGGIPLAFRFYNSPIDADYNPLKFIAMLREYVDGKKFHESLRDSKIYKKLHTILNKMNGAGVSLPKDFHGANILVSNNGQPYIIDLEEAEHNHYGIETEKNMAAISKLREENQHFTSFFNS